ncbi:Hsp70 family protein [Actinoplanes flavus]|uniref:Hsp70 family protein n=1 Tax=Actinoplanes flavus TaxID=2820290 RepID=A0ABS3URB5_9ACTN|nr:Hsp70 family protein [Actinoplanes flavus]MBO3741319.1 Hsp70 family protein [Actinoplanes flavus]
MYALGIDLGTTYTAAAVWRSGHAEIVSLGSRSAAVPSVVLLRADETILTGEIASRRGLTEPHRVAREFKRRLGDPTPILLGGAPYSAESLMARMLRAVIDEVSSREGGEPNAICVSHPANWGPYKIDLLYQVLRLAGIERPVQLITEPHAAAVFYARQQRLEPDATVAVYDLGGGTFDAAVLRKTPDGFDLIGKPEGIERLGGIDFDAAIFAHVAGSLDGALDDLDGEDPAVTAAVARLREECVQAKEALSVDTDVTIPVLLPALTTEVRLTRAELEAMVRPVLSGPTEALRRAVRSAGIEPADLHSVLLVGGSSRIPLVAQMVGAEFGRPVAVDAHPKHAVALGAAWHAGASIAEAQTALVLPEAVDPWATGAAEAVAPAWPGDAWTATAEPAPESSRPPATSGAPVPEPAGPTAAVASPAGRPKLSRPVGAVLAAAVVALLAGVAGTVWAVDRFGGDDRTKAPATEAGMHSPQHTPAAGATASPSASVPASAAAAPVPADEACTDQMRQSPRWVCLSRATIRDGKFVIWYEADWNGETPDTVKGFHLHVYGGDGQNPDETTMGSQVTAHGEYYFEDQQPSVRRTSDADFEAVGDAPKVCARIAKSGHGLARAADGSYHTGNCIPIQRD